MKLPVGSTSIEEISKDFSQAEHSSAPAQRYGNQIRGAFRPNNAITNRLTKKLSRENFSELEKAFSSTFL